MALKNAVHCGLKPADFWELTPAELNIVIEVNQEKSKMEYKEKLNVAFYNAYFQRTKSLSQKELHSIFEKIDSAGKEVTDKDMLVNVMKLHKMFGGEK